MVSIPWLDDSTSLISSGNLVDNGIVEGKTAFDWSIPCDVSQVLPDARASVRPSTYKGGGAMPRHCVCKKYYGIALHTATISWRIVIARRRYHNRETHGAIPESMAQGGDTRIDGARRRYQNRQAHEAIPESMAQGGDTRIAW